jgi:hypothetical protein
MDIPYLNFEKNYLFRKRLRKIWENVKLNEKGIQQLS